MAMTLGSRTAMTITLASLASSTNGLSARQSTLIDNSSTGAHRVYVTVKIKLGTSPTASKFIYVWGLRGDGTDRDSSAGASDAALTIKNAYLLGVIDTGSGATTGSVYRREFVFEAPGREWGVAIGHDTGVNLDSTGGNHSVYYVPETV